MMIMTSAFYAAFELSDMGHSQLDMCGQKKTRRSVLPKTRSADCPANGEK